MYRLAPWGSQFALVARRDVFQLVHYPLGKVQHLNGVAGSGLSAAVAEVWPDSLAVEEEKVAELGARVKELEAALDEWATHHYECSWFDTNYQNCNCGFSEWEDRRAEDRQTGQGPTR